MQNRISNHVPRRAQPRWGMVIGAAVAALAGAALFNGAKARAATRAHPPHGRFVEVGGIEVHYTEHGPADATTPPIVLLHGQGTMIEDFELSGVVGILSERHRVIVFDRPGLGYTPRPRDGVWTPWRQAKLLSEATAKLGAVRPVVVAHSWAPLVAIRWALDFPEVGALVLASGFYFGGPLSEAVTRATAGAGRVPVVGDVLLHTVMPITGRLSEPAMLRAMFGPADTPRAFAAEFPFELMHRPSQLRAVSEDGAQLVSAARALEPRYEELKLPVVFITGDSDRIVDFTDQTKRLAGQLSQSRLVVVPGAGHMVHYFAPERFAAAVELAVEGVG